MEVALNPTDEDARVIVEGIDGVLKRSTEERLADVQQIEADARRVVLAQEVLNEPNLALAVARPECNQIQPDRTERLAQRLGE